MSEQKPRSQFKDPKNTPDKEKGDPSNDKRQTTGEDIIEGARQEDQLEQLKPTQNPEEGEEATN